MNPEIQTVLEARFGQMPVRALCKVARRLCTYHFYPYDELEDLEQQLILHLLAVEATLRGTPEKGTPAYYTRCLYSAVVDYQRYALYRAAVKPMEDLPERLSTPPPDVATRLDLEALLLALPRELRPIVLDVMAGYTPSISCRRNGFDHKTFSRRIVPILKPLLEPTYAARQHATRRTADNQRKTQTRNVLPR